VSVDTALDEVYPALTILIVATSVPGFEEGVYKSALKVYRAPTTRPVRVCVT
tara:strand:- start:281 stop:436 length:156 start_codon:yes stop_codon:yes gene_type:complete